MSKGTRHLLADYMQTSVMMPRSKQHQVHNLATGRQRLPHSHDIPELDHNLLFHGLTHMTIRSLKWNGHKTPAPPHPHPSSNGTVTSQQRLESQNVQCQSRGIRVQQCNIPTALPLFVHDRHLRCARTKHGTKPKPTAETCSQKIPSDCQK